MKAVNYFVYNGKRYYAGSEIKIRDSLYKDPVYNHLATFHYHDLEHDNYFYRMHNTGTTFVDKGDLFFKKLCGVSKEADGSIGAPQEKQLKDSQIPRLAIGWVWYIFIMLVSLIFNGRFVIWTIASIVFFRWRKEVIKEEGHYVEWPL